MDTNVDAWSDADNYEPYMGRWSRQLASELLVWLDVAPDARWLDFGCGTGAVTAAILAQADPRSVLAVDPSRPYLDAARAAISDPRATFLLGTAESLRDLPLQLDAIVSGLVLNFVPDPRATLDYLARTADEGATVGVYVWDYSEMEMLGLFWDVASTFPASAPILQRLERFADLDRDELEGVVGDAGFTQVESQEVTVSMVFPDFDDYWRPLLGRQGPASYLLGELAPDDRDDLGEALRAVLPIESDGSIHLRARALMARGTASFR